MTDLRLDQDPGCAITAWRPGTSPVLVLVGRVHVGKTHAGCALVNGHIPADTDSIGAAYFRAHELVRPDGEVRSETDLHWAAKAALLFLDDMGAVLLNAGIRSLVTPSMPFGPLYEMLDKRLSEHRPVVVATNLPAGDAVTDPNWPTFTQMYGKLADRLLRDAAIAHLAGPAYEPED